MSNSLVHGLQSRRSPESDRRVVIVAVGIDIYAVGWGQSREFYWPIRELQSTGRHDEMFCGDSVIS